MKAVFLALVASFVWGVAPVIFKTGLGGRTDIAVALVVHNLSAFLVSLIYLLLAGTWSVAPRELVFLLLGGAFSGFLGMFFFFHAVKEGEVSVVAPIASISPLWASILASLLLGERITVLRLLGALLIVMGTALLALSSKR
ncbi:protein of unknown function DUF6 transmembrane [Thermocrinis albus DSM 14484]|uniref:EamA domain-containing protein n=1 Tax=Thermocrinis albus (strain DSM 14484 / JCM 11386 / HI 11/12) TaxID=638303 RepID=D3SMF8_THEAH|nr:EamA family transporter [Thermocrinis albus]ADC89938.1 protein of unknown function DUF6 transmembrane [Thermocrinis albus DSM 14484]